MLRRRQDGFGTTTLPLERCNWYLEGNTGLVQSSGEHFTQLFKVVGESVDTKFGGRDRLNNSNMEPLKRLKLQLFDVPQVTLVEIQEVERAIKSELPETYEELLLFYNGGVPTLNTFWLDSEEYIVNCFFFLENPKAPVTDAYLSTEGLWWNYNSLSTMKPSNFLPFASDPNGNLFCFDTNYGRTAPVHFWDHEASHEHPFHLSRTFDEFIDRLQAYAGE